MKRPQETEETETNAVQRTAVPSYAVNSGSSNRAANTSNADKQEEQPLFTPPSINLPKGGGAIQGIGEKFQANPVTGTGSMSVPIAMSVRPGGFTSQLYATAN